MVSNKVIRKGAVCIKRRTRVYLHGDARRRKVGQEQMSTKTCPKSSNQARYWERASKCSHMVGFHAGNKLPMLPGDEAARGSWHSANNAISHEVQRPKNVGRSSCFCGIKSFVVKYELLQKPSNWGTRVCLKAPLCTGSHSSHLHCTYRSNGSRLMPKGTKPAYVAHYRWGPAFPDSNKDVSCRGHQLQYNLLAMHKGPIAP
jgi:hypothetical protein